MIIISQAFIPWSMMDSFWTSQHLLWVSFFKVWCSMRVNNWYVSLNWHNFCIIWIHFVKKFHLWCVLFSSCFACWWLSCWISWPCTSVTPPNLARFLSPHHEKDKKSLTWPLITEVSRLVQCNIGHISQFRC